MKSQNNVKCAAMKYEEAKIFKNSKNIFLEITVSSIHHAHYSVVQSPFPTRGSTAQHRPRPRPTSRLLGVEYIPPCRRSLAEAAVEAAGERRAVPAPARRSCAARSPKGSPLSN